jgi:hypothetical protein
MAVTFLVYDECEMGIDALACWLESAMRTQPPPRQHPDRANPTSHTAARPNTETSAPAWWLACRSLLSGATAGLLGKLAVYPLDTVKKRLQVQPGAHASAKHHYKGTLHAMRTIAVEEGVIRGLYRGESDWHESEANLSVTTES